MYEYKKPFNEVAKNIFKWAYIITVQSMQTIVLASIALYFDRLYEFILIVIGFQIGKAALGETYHAATMITCTLISGVLFAIACAIVPTSQTSLIMQATIGVGMAFLLSVIEHYRKKICRINEGE